MSNPYQAPESGIKTERRDATSKVHVALSLLIAAFCVLQFWGILTAVAQAVLEIQLDGPTVLQLLYMLALPGALFLGGVLLAFGRKAAALLFAAYVVMYLAEIGLREDFGNALTLILGTVFLAYSMWLWKRGQLRGWPDSAPKPVPLRGA